MVTTQTKKPISKSILKKVLSSQKNEITEYYVYKKLAASTNDSHNKKVLSGIAKDEMLHYKTFKKYTKVDVKPSKFNIWKYYVTAKLLGLTFSLKYMEKGEKNAQLVYKQISRSIPEAAKIIKDENIHEKKLIDILKEEKLKYVGSIVLGLNDALVELTGALAGFSFALQNSRLVAITGLITGIAASLSMATSEYIATKTDNSGKVPKKAAVYTGLAYVLTVFFLIFPFFVLDNVYFSLLISLINAIVVILFFTFYVSVAKEIQFKRRFLEMVSMSLGVAAITFVIGMLIRIFIGVDI